jgi:hypothetical protein
VVSPPVGGIFANFGYCAIHFCASAAAGPLFDYYGPMEQFREMAAKQASRQILAMNEQQKRQVHETTGRMGSFMEIELDEGQAQIIRIW